MKRKFTAFPLSLALKGTVSRDWGELLMVEIDKIKLPEMIFIEF